MKNWIVMLITMIFLVSLAGCGLPAVQSTLDTVAATSNSIDWTPTFTLTPSPTMTPLPTLTPTPSATPIPPTPTSNPQPVYCANEYWPIVLGATWEFTGTLTVYSGLGSPGKESQTAETWQITQVEGNYPYPAHFRISTGYSQEYYQCDETGIYREFGTSKAMVLPPVSKLVPGQTVWENKSTWEATMVGEPETINTPLGLIDTIPIAYIPNEGRITYWFAPNIGLVQYGGGYTSSKNLTLNSYTIFLPGPTDGATTCSLAGIISPTLSSNISYGCLSETDELSGGCDFSNGGQVLYLRPGLRLIADQGQTAYLALQPYYGMFAVRFVNHAAYKIALVPWGSETSWQQLIQQDYGSISMVLDVDDSLTPNAGVYYQKIGDQTLALLNDKWDMVDGQAYTAIFDLSHDRFKLYDQNSQLIIDDDLSGFWGPEYTGHISLGSFPVWTIGAGWTDTSYPTDLLVQEVCYGNSE